jgi:hypothetical protein
MNGWNLGELRLNEKNKAPIRTWIIIIDIGDKNRKVVVQRTWTKGRERKR